MASAALRIHLKMKIAWPRGRYDGSARVSARYDRILPKKVRGTRVTLLGSHF